MKLENTFSIPVPAADAWPVLLDLERIAPCVPGATLTSRDGDDFHGKIKVKLGPVGLTYNGIIKVVSQDPQARIAVLEGGGRETRGNGTAKATIICRLVESEGSTAVFVDTELAITGKPAQFGRGALADVAGTLIGQFAANLATEITSTAQAAAPATSPEPAAAADAPAEIRAVPRASAEPIDLLAAAGVGRSGRAIAVAAGIVLVLALLLTRRRRSRS
ncbi:SRPBCC family protein [Nocardia sp. GCM10030253]|uniref:SRPBCC family protein n=1 Tax=Nocardia sp. GCM10030253 TaxID=3273404 RepID=UPI00362AEFAE